MMLTQDKKSLVVAASNGQAAGLIDLVDLATGRVVNHASNEPPTKLLRLGANRGMWVLGAREMRSVSETGEVGEKPILRNKPRKSEEGDTGSEDVFMNGHAGETIAVGEDYAAILISNKNGPSLHRVALLDLKQLQVASIVPTMSRSEHAKILAGRWAEALAVAAAEGAIGAGAGVPPPNLFTPILPAGLANEALAARPDGHFLYVLDTDSHEVTVIDVPTATVAVRIPVDKSIRRLEVSSDGKYLSCIGKIVQKIDLESNKLAA